MRPGYFRVYLAPKRAVFFEWHTSRSGKCLEKSAPLLESIKELLLAEHTAHLPRSATGRAIDYTLSRWAQLTLYVRDARRKASLA